MAYSSITSMSYVSSVNNSGNGVRARFTFEGVNNGKLDANDTWAVSFDNTNGPYTMLLNKSTSEQVEGVTAKILTSSAASGNVSGTLELYPLTAGTTYTFQAFDSAYTPTFYFDFTPNIDDTPKIKNLASGTLAESVSASATTLSVFVGNGSASTIKGVWPDTPFYATLMPSNPTAGVPNSLDSEIVKVTDVGNDQVGNTSLTVVRGQKGSTTQAFAEGAIVTNADYVEEAVLLGDEGTPETPSPWIKYNDIITNNTTDANGWTILRLSEKATLYRRTFTFSNVSVPGGYGFGAVAVNINKPANVSFSESDVIGEAVSCPTGEVFFHRIDDLSNTTCRLYAINSTATARTISGYYTLTCIKITT